MKQLLVMILSLSFVGAVMGAMEIPRGAFLFKDLEKAKAEAVKKEKAICFFVT